MLRAHSLWVHIEMHTKPNGMQEEIIAGIYSAEEACMLIVDHEMNWWTLFCALGEPCVLVDSLNPMVVLLCQQNMGRGRRNTA